MTRLPTWLMLVLSIAGATLVVLIRKFVIAQTTGAPVGESFAEPAVVIVEIAHCATPFIVLALLGIRLPICWIAAAVLTALFQLWYVRYWITRPLGGGADMGWIWIGPGSVIGTTAAAMILLPFFADARPREP